MPQTVNISQTCLLVTEFSVSQQSHQEPREEEEALSKLCISQSLLASGCLPSLPLSLYFPGYW